MARMILLNPIGMGDDELAHKVGQLAATTGHVGEVVSGRADWQKFYPFEGSWEAWAKGCASRHDTFVVFGRPGAPLGRGTARIVEEARKANKPVCLWDGGMFYTTEEGGT